MDYEKKQIYLSFIIHFRFGFFVCFFVFFFGASHFTPFIITIDSIVVKTDHYQIKITINNISHHTPTKQKKKKIMYVFIVRKWFVFTEAIIKNVSNAFK